MTNERHNDEKVQDSAGATLGLVSAHWAVPEVPSNMGTVESKHVLLGLAFLKRVIQRFDKQQRGIIRCLTMSIMPGGAPMMHHYRS